VFEPVGCGGVGLCAVAGLNLYKVVANGSIGTGPNFVDAAALGVPGFNEFYYLRHYPDAAETVRRGEYSSGLAHYVAVGMARGYLPHAPNARPDFVAIRPHRDGVEIKPYILMIVAMIVIRSGLRSRRTRPRTNSPREVTP
jgi:hypothetical protein